MTHHTFETISASPRATHEWGRRLGLLLTGGEVIGLTGDLGSGKTCFVRGLAQGLEVGEESWVRSPSFTLINEYRGRVPLIHMDLFRVSPGPEMDDLALDEYLFSNGVSVIEWFDRLTLDGLETYLEVAFRYSGERNRVLAFVARGQKYDEILQKLRTFEVEPER